MKPEIFGPLPLDSDADLHRRILSIYKTAQKAGEFVLFRTDPTGKELLIWMAQTPVSKPVAFATFYEAKPKSVWLDLIWVAPEHRRKGLAKAMLLNVNAISKRMGMHQIEFGTILDNAAMRSAGRLVGFSDSVIVMGRQL